MKKLLAALLVTCYLLPVTCKAQTPYVAIPDSNFVHYLKTIVPTAFKGDSLNKNSSAVTTYTQTINVNSRSIANLSGVQYFTSLTALMCNTNSLTTLPALSNTLTYLDCSYNSILSLPTLPNSLLELYCWNNALTSLPALPNSLIYLTCFNNNLTSLPILPDSLYELVCNNNNLTSLPALPNTLIALVCDHNNIACFPTFPNAITQTSYFSIDPNPYNCLPNYISAMGSTDLAMPLCAAGNTNGCAVAGIQQVAGINTQVTVYPNPASSSLQVAFSGNTENNALVITDMLGNTVKQSVISNLTSIINVADLSEGIYNLSISTKEGVANKRVVISK